MPETKWSENNWWPLLSVTFFFFFLLLLTTTCESTTVCLICIHRFVVWFSVIFFFFCSVCCMQRRRCAFVRYHRGSREQLGYRGEVASVRTVSAQQGLWGEDFRLSSSSGFDKLYKPSITTASMSWFLAARIQLYLVWGRLLQMWTQNFCVV